MSIAMRLRGRSRMCPTLDLMTYPDPRILDRVLALEGDSTITRVLLMAAVPEIAPRAGFDAPGFVVVFFTGVLFVVTVAFFVSEALFDTVFDAVFDFDGDFAEDGCFFLFSAFAFADSPSAGGRALRVAIVSRATGWMGSGSSSPKREF
jgi:hypothetical protein